MEQNLEPKIETKPGKKKIFLIVGAVVGVLVIAAAAFIGGQLLNRRANGLGMMPFSGDGGAFTSVSLMIEPAPELPTTQPEVVGTFAERQDNTIYIQEFSMSMGGGGVVISVGGAEDASGGPVTSSSAPESGPKVEVVVTNDTLIYADVTPFDLQPGENQTVQQVVEPGSLDDLTSQTMVQVWGRKVGDRVIADVIAYSNPVVFTAP